MIHYGSHLILPNSYSPWYHMPLPSSIAHELVVTVESKGKTYTERRIVREHDYVGFSTYGPLPNTLSITTVVVPLEGCSALIVDFDRYLRGTDIKITGSRCYYVDDLDSPNVVKEFIYYFDKGIAANTSDFVTNMSISFDRYYGNEDFSDSSEVKYDLTNFDVVAPDGAYNSYHHALSRLGIDQPVKYRLFRALLGTAIMRNENGSFSMVKKGQLPKYNDEKGRTPDLFWGNYYDEGYVPKGTDMVLKGYDISYFDYTDSLQFYNLCSLKSPSENVKPVSFIMKDHQWVSTSTTSCLESYFQATDLNKNPIATVNPDEAYFSYFLSPEFDEGEIPVRIGDIVYRFGDVKNEFVYSAVSDVIFYIYGFEYLTLPVFSDPK
ncbi:hypothetical protein [Pseudodesulfovibrio sp. zrk46]|uniref:hypothetical protein n=1 Tax=Pseudodesulfovibrio sp. zrk46 TaxID=2725288 RepID=UPI0014490996|nr:hypothetical protein [Pseudodesulfovibrio sp. zrk46]QJB56969.1 hypothetical protein HFN16_11375 [Pseudodesulfovibrio sp. zrk46]